MTNITITSQAGQNPISALEEYLSVNETNTSLKVSLNQVADIIHISIASIGRSRASQYIFEDKIITPISVSKENDPINNASLVAIRIDEASLPLFNSKMRSYLNQKMHTAVEEWEQTVTQTKTALTHKLHDALFNRDLADKDPTSSMNDKRKAGVDVKELKLELEKLDVSKSDLVKKLQQMKLALVNAYSTPPSSPEEEAHNDADNHTDKAFILEEKKPNWFTKLFKKKPEVTDQQLQANIEKLRGGIALS